MFDEEDTLVHVKIEFDMRASRKDRYLDGFHKMMPIIKTYDRKVPNRNVVCFVPTEELRLEVLQNGAAMAGGTELIKDIQMGRVDIVSSINFKLFIFLNSVEKLEIFEDLNENKCKF